MGQRCLSVDNCQHYQLFIIGGSLGALSCARQAASLGLKVGLVDYQSDFQNQNQKWDSFKVIYRRMGSVPKKLIHYTALLGEMRSDQKFSGWKISQEQTIDWEKVQKQTFNFIKAANQSCIQKIKAQNITYYTKGCKFIDCHTIQLSNNSGEKQIITADNILIAPQGIRQLPNIPGAKEYCITTDDILWIKKYPGKTLIVGNDANTFENAGFLLRLGCSVTVLTNETQVMPNLDYSITEKIIKNMQEKGLNIIYSASIVKITQKNSGSKTVQFTKNNKKYERQFRTVIFDTQKVIKINDLKIHELGIKVINHNKIKVNQDQSTSIGNIFALGQIVSNRPSNNSAMMLAGKLLAQRLAKKSKKLMEYKYIPQIIFTPIQYSYIGLNQIQAKKKFKEQNISAYGSIFKPLQWNMNLQRSNPVYAKMIVNDADQRRVIGLHFMGPNAGETIQGFILGLKLGATKKDFDQTIGIHPTCAEEFTILTAKVGTPEQQKGGC